MTKVAKALPEPAAFLAKVEFRHAALLSFITSAIIVPGYEAVKRDFGIIRAEYMLLLCLSHFPALTAQDVSRLTGRPRNSISRAVHRMLAVGYIERVPDPADRRQATLTITAAGRALHDEIAQYIVERQEKVLLPLDDVERATLDELLDKLATHAAALDD